MTIEQAVALLRLVADLYTQIGMQQARIVELEGANPPAFVDVDVEP